MSVVQHSTLPSHIARDLKSSLYGRGTMDSKLLLKFIGYFPEYLSALSRTLLRFFWTTFAETAVFFRSVRMGKEEYLQTSSVCSSPVKPNILAKSKATQVNGAFLRFLTYDRKIEPSLYDSGCKES